MKIQYNLPPTHYIRAYVNGYFHVYSGIKCIKRLRVSGVEVRHTTLIRKHKKGINSAFINNRVEH